MTSHHQSLARLIRANEFQHASSPRSGLLHASPAPTRCAHHQLSLLSTTRSSLTHIISATHILPTRKRLVSHNIVCHRQDTFLVSHGIKPECTLHSHRQMSSIPRLSGQNSDFSCGTSLNTFHHSCSAPSNELCVMAFSAISTSLVFSSVKRAVCNDLSTISSTN